MRNGKIIALALAVAVCGPPVRAADGDGLSGLRRDFAAPPQAARLQAWWHWIGDNADREKLLRDLDALHDFGVGTVHVFSSYATYELRGLWKRMLSEAWLDVFRAVLVRAKEHGMTLGFHNCPGWSASGGPWIPVEKSMKVLVASEADVGADAKAVALPRPRAVRHDFYRDVAVLAIQVGDDPTPVARSVALPTALPISRPGSRASVTYEFASAVTNFTTAVMEFDDVTFRTPFAVEASSDGTNWTALAETTLSYYRTALTPKTVALAPAPEGSRFYRVSFAYMETPSHVPHIDVRLRGLTFTTENRIADLDAQTAVSGHGMRCLRLPSEAAVPRGIPADGVRDVSSALGADGTVDLAAAALPAPSSGRHWRLLRFGFTTTGARNKPAPVSGLECDKLDRSGIEAHWPHMPGLLASLPEARGVLRYCIIDSYEAGGQNWTDRMPEQFLRLRGYSLVPFLPALTGYVIGDGETSARFLYDFQRTVSDLFRTEYYGRFAELCRESGLQSIVEGYDGPYDPMEISLCADVPAGEFWLRNEGASNADVNKTPVWASSAAHLRGSPFAAAESFTTEAKQGRWQATPAELRRAGDRAWLNGISQLVYHSYVAQLFENVKPGMSLSQHGTQLNRNTTWWPEGRAWTDYVARGQALLQSGRSHAEFLIVSGEGDPSACESYPHDLVAAGFGFDWIPPSWLPRLVVTDDGKVGLPGLPPYEALLLPADRCCSLATAVQLNRLLLAGAKLAGRRPLASPVLHDGRANWEHAVNELCPGLPQTWRDLGLRPFADSCGRLLACRRDIGDATVYYLLNDRDTDFCETVSFDAKADGAVRPFTAAELWKAEDGSIAALAATADGDRLSVRLHLAAHRSAFVVLSKGGDDGSRSQPVISGQEPASPLMDLSSDWQVTFEGLAAPEPMTFAKLQSWSLSDDPKLRYFSGRARYSKTVTLPTCSPIPDPRSLLLSLGEVHDVANVFIGGRKIATLWEGPYEVEFAPPGKMFKLEVEVVNTWPNRLIGDAIFRRDHPGCEKMGDPKVWHAWEAKNVDPPKSGIFPQWVLDERADSGVGVCTWSNFDWAWSADDALLPAGLIGPVRLHAVRRSDK